MIARQKTLMRARPRLLGAGGRSSC